MSMLGFSHIRSKLFYSTDFNNCLWTHNHAVGPACLHLIPSNILLRLRHPRNHWWDFWQEKSRFWPHLGLMPSWLSRFFDCIEGPRNLVGHCCGMVALNNSTKRKSIHGTFVPILKISLHLVNRLNIIIINNENDKKTENTLCELINTSICTI